MENLIDYILILLIGFCFYWFISFTKYHWIGLILFFVCLIILQKRLEKKKFVLPKS